MFDALKEAGRKLARSVVEFDESDQPKLATPQAVVQKPATFTLTTTSVAQTTVDQDMVTQLQGVIGARKTPYTALLEASNKLLNVIPDEITRLKAAFAMISGDGQRSITSITQAIDVHAADIDGELMRFKQSTTSNIALKVETLRSSVSGLITANESRQKQIVELQTQIARDTDRANEQTNQANQAEADINQVAARFNTAAEFVKQDLVNKKAQLTTVLS